MKTVQPVSTVSTSNLTMEVETVTHTLRGSPQEVIDYTHATILTDSMSLLQKVKRGIGSRLECVNVQNPPSKTPVDVLPWTCWKWRRPRIKIGRHLRVQILKMHTTQCFPTQSMPVFSPSQGSQTVVFQDADMPQFSH